MAKVQQFVNADATIVTVRTLGIGNVYKRLEEGNSYSSDKIIYGVVTDVQHNGEKSFVAALEFNPDEYGGSSLTNKTFGGETEVNIFSCSIADWEAAMTSNRNSVERGLRDKQAEVEKALANRALLLEMASKVTEDNALTEAITG